MKPKKLPPGSPEAKRRDELLAIMNDASKSVNERLEAAAAALPLCHVKRAVIVGANAADVLQKLLEDGDFDDPEELLREAQRLLGAETAQ